MPTLTRRRPARRLTTPVDTTKTRLDRALYEGRARIVMMGSSTLEGSGAPSFDSGVAQRFQTLLRQRAGLSGGRGWLPAYQNHTSHPNPIDPVGAVVRAGGSGFGLKTLRMEAAGHGATFSFFGTSCDVVYSQYGGGATITISVDGGAAVTVDTNAATLDRFRRWNSGPLTRGNHTVTIAFGTAPAGSFGAFLRGAFVYDQDETRGVHVYNGSISGAVTNDFSANVAQWDRAIAVINPHHVILDLGRNDYNSQVSDVTMFNNLRTIIQAIKANSTTNPGITLISFPAVAGRSVAESIPYVEYQQRWKALARAERNVSVLDVSSVIPSSLRPSVGYLGTFFQPDLTHLNDRGHDVLARHLAHTFARNLPR